METLIYLGIAVLGLMGLPLFVVMSAFALAAFSFAEIETSAVAVEMFRVASAPTLMTIPLFTFAGYVMAESRSPERILKLAQAFFGWLPNGVAIVSLIVCAFFTAFTGASGVTIIALGGLLFPILSKEGFHEKFTLGLITTSGSLGLLFAPSLPIILYGLVAKVDIEKLFLAGVLPGCFLIAILAWFAARQNNGGSKRQRGLLSWADVRAAVIDARYEIPLPILVLVGIYGGFTTVTEASALTAGYVVLMECFLYRDLKLFRDLPRIICESMTLVGAILLILCCALGLTNYLIDEEVPLHILEIMRQYISNKYMFLLCLNIFLLIVGGLMDIFSAIIVVVPLIVPIANEFDIHPVHLAIIFLTNLEIGYITPPVGINLFISSFRFKRPVTELYQASLPFLFLLLIALAVITYVPILSLAWIE